MKKTWIAILTAVLSLGLFTATDADAAKRLGGGSSIGKQRATTPPASPPAAQPQAPAAAPAAAPAPQPSGMSRWLGPLAGLALGAGLASMFAGNGGGFAAILLMLLVAAAVIFALRMLRSKPQGAPLEYAGGRAEPQLRSAEPQIRNDMSTGFGGAAPVTPAANRFPPGFDAAQFAHHAKLNFTKLQAANDRGDLTAMRDFMTPELYAEIEAQIKARGGAPQKTDVVTLNADVLGVVTEGNVHVASVNFSGMIREESDATPTPFSEIWHLEKPLDGRTGWLISGIQQN